MSKLPPQFQAVLSLRSAVTPNRPRPTEVQLLVPICMGLATGVAPCVAWLISLANMPAEFWPHRNIVPPWRMAAPLLAPKPTTLQLLAPI